jgi:hypothetical protein
MKNLFILLVIACVFVSCGTPKDAFEYKPIEIDFVKVVSKERLIDARMVTFYWFVYRDYNGQEHWLPVYRGPHNTLLVKL